MAFAGSSVISPVLTPTPNLRYRSPHRQKPNFLSHSNSLFNSCTPIPTFSLTLAKLASVSHSQMHGSNPVSPLTNSWSEFAKNVSGEWDGFGADFTTQGKPIELPENVVPEAFREWEVKVFDWQTQCPTLAQQEEMSMAYRTIKLLPTVGCEADAATRYKIDERNVGSVDNEVSAFAYQSSGSYVAVWPVEGHGSCKQLELEYCLINPQDRESRVRVFLVVRLVDAQMNLQNISVYVEQWYGPFRNGDQLGGCSIRDSAFASTDPQKASEIVGVWQGPTAVADFNTSSSEFVRELLDGGDQNSLRDEDGIILLPKKLWCSVKGNKDGKSYCEVGWLYSHGCALTSRCIFSSDATLKEISIALETANSTGV